jgi:hypothetical protein
MGCKILRFICRWAHNPAAHREIAENDMKELLIHIGLHKTGTSAIQAFLRDNRTNLLKQGILYPLNIEAWVNHNPLIWHLMEAKYLPKNHAYYVKESSAKHWETLRCIIGESDAPRVLLSAEDFCLIDPEKIAELCFGFSTRILIYLRRQDQYLQSVYNEDVKSFGFMREESFDAFLKTNRLNDIIHYERFLQRWIDAFGRDRINVGIYDRAHLAQGLIFDFTSRAGICLDESIKRPQRKVNASLPGNILEIKRLLNRFHLSEWQHRFLLDSLMNTPMVHRQKKASYSDHTFLTHERRKAFLEQFQEGNQAVALNFFGESAHLFPDPEEEPDISGIPAPALPDSATLLSELIGPMLQDLTFKLEAATIPMRPQTLHEPDGSASETDPLKVPFQKDAMTPESAALFRLPSSAQDNSNLYSMVNWAPVYIPLLDAVRPQCIVEIGSEYGGNTGCLGRYCIDRGIRLHVVDTHPTIDPMFEQNHLICYHKARSVDFLKGFNGAEVYFIDGDHNYPTVSEELEQISNNHDGRRPLLLLMHDTGWPLGIVDCFYDPSTIQGDLPPLTSAGGPLPWRSAMDEHGFGKGSYSYPLRAGGEKNGVRAAIEEFVMKNKGWRTAYFTPFYGLCFLWKEDSLPSALSEYLGNLIATLERVEPVFATLEWNRILLYIQSQFMGMVSERAGKIWQEQQSWIEHLEGRLRSAGIRF